MTYAEIHLLEWRINVLVFFTVYLCWRSFMFDFSKFSFCTHSCLCFDFVLFWWIFLILYRTNLAFSIFYSNFSEIEKRIFFFFNQREDAEIWRKFWILQLRKDLLHPKTVSFFVLPHHTRDGFLDLVLHLNREQMFVWTLYYDYLFFHLKSILTILSFNSSHLIFCVWGHKGTDKLKQILILCYSRIITSTSLLSPLH